MQIIGVRLLHAGPAVGRGSATRRKLTASTTFTLPAINHISVCIRMCDALFTTGGGVEVDGWGHNYEFIEASSGGENTQLSHERGVGGARVWHCDFNNNLGNWGSGSKGMRNCDFGDLHYLTPPDNSNLVACRTQGAQLHGRRHGDQRLPVLTVRCLQVAHDAARLRSAFSRACSSTATVARRGLIVRPALDVADLLRAHPSQVGQRLRAPPRGPRASPATRPCTSRLQFALETFKVR